MSVFMSIDGLQEAVEFYRKMPDAFETAAVLSMNTVTARSGLTEARREMRKQIDFPGGYLEEGRLRVGRKARKGMLETSIVGRDRATSLARFARGQTVSNTRGQGVRVNVKKGQTQVLRRGFLVNLKNGNTGLAVRLKKGEQLRNSEKAVRLDNDVYLLYGPSVDQVFKGVASDIAPRLGDQLSREFFRQFQRIVRG